MHQIKKYEMVKVKRAIVDSVKKIKVEKTTNWIDRRTAANCRLEKALKEYSEELEVIEDMCAKFAYILADNSSTVGIPRGNSLFWPWGNVCFSAHRPSVVSSSRTSIC